MSTKDNILNRILVALRSPRGRDAMMFMVFVVISAILWLVLSLNEEEQYDVRMPLKITHVPDSVTLITDGPPALSASLTAKGTQLLKMNLGRTPTVNVDYRIFRSGNCMHVSAADLKGLVRQASGGSQVSVVFPDTLHIPFTTHQGFKLPVAIDYRVTAGPQASLTGAPRLSTDSVKVYMANNALPDRFDAVTTEPVRILGLDKTTTQRVKLTGPRNSRIVPDSIDVTFEVEPLIFKSRKVVIEPVNVPRNVKLITFPAQIDVFYMIPVSEYHKGRAQFRVVADYRTLSQSSGKVKLSLRDVGDKLQNVHISADSAEYIIERHHVEHN